MCLEFAKVCNDLSGIEAYKVVRMVAINTVPAYVPVAVITTGTADTRRGWLMHMEQDADDAFWPMRDKNRNPIGTVVAIKNGNDILLGWSKLHVGVDSFSKPRGRQIAIGRALFKSVPTPPAKDRQMIAEHLTEILQRAKKYFKLDNPNFNWPLPIQE